MKAVRLAGATALVVSAAYFLFGAVAVWVSYAWNQAQGGSAYFGDAASDAGVAAVLLVLVASTAVLARRGGPVRMLLTAAGIALPLSLLAIVWAAVAAVGF